MTIFMKNKQVHTSEPSNFDAIFHRILILLHKSERTEIRKNRTETEPNKLFRGSRLFRVPMTALHSIEPYQLLITCLV